MHILFGFFLLQAGDQQPAPGTVPGLRAVLGTEQSSVRPAQHHPALVRHLFPGQEPEFDLPVIREPVNGGAFRGIEATQFHRALADGTLYRVVLSATHFQYSR